MRIRTWVAMAVGAAAGAGSVYLLDPDHGEARRRAAVERARARARHELVALVREASAQAKVVVDQARGGFVEARGPGGTADHRG